MNPLTGTLDGWLATARAARWSPVVAVPAAATAALLGAGFLAGGDPRDIAVVGETGLAAAAVVTAFAADDPGGEAAPATPTEATVRLAARAALMVPAAAFGWLLVLGAYAWAVPGLPVDLGRRALAGAAVAVAALAIAALSSRLRGVASPGAAGTAALAVVGVTLQVLPSAWLQHLPSGAAAPAGVVAVGLAVVARAMREPAGA